MTSIAPTLKTTELNLAAKRHVANLMRPEGYEADTASFQPGQPLVMHHPSFDKPSRILVRAMTRATLAECPLRKRGRAGPVRPLLAASQAHV